MTVAGWRMFTLRDDGALLPPFVDRYWFDLASPAGEPWSQSATRARCLVSDHLAPDEGCTCGLRATEQLRELLDMRRFVDSSRTVLEDTGVIARVELSGRLLPGYNVPEDDPPTTWRGEQGRVLEVHLAPSLAGHAGAVQKRYRVPVVTYRGAEWFTTVRALPAAPIPEPAGTEVPSPFGDTAAEGVGARVGVGNLPTVTPARGPEAFLVEVRAAGFGRKSMTGDLTPLVNVARMLIDSLRGGAPVDEAVAVLLSSSARPTMPQVRRFVTAAVRCLGPDCAGALTAFRTTFNGTDGAHPAAHPAVMAAVWPV